MALQTLSCSRLTLLAVASILVLLCQQTPWGAAAHRVGPARSLQQTIASPAVSGDIPMAPVAVLTAALKAARLCNLAYPETVLGTADAEASYSDPAKFQLYATAVQNAVSNMTTYPLSFVQRLSFSPAGPIVYSRFVYAFIMPTKTAVYVVFRGTDTTGGFGLSLNARTSIGVDSNTVQTTFKEASAGKVHSGFYVSLTDPSTYIYDETQVNGRSAYADIKQEIQKAVNLVGKVPLIFTGHSLGAAQAALAAFMLQLEGTYQPILYTFGMPQVGNLAWRNAFDAALANNHYRWWNQQDPVPQFPNADVDPGCYDWAGCDQSWFTVDSLYRIFTLPGGSLRCGIPSGYYAVCDLRNTTQPPLNVQSCYATISYLDIWSSTDHSLDNYRTNLKACRDLARTG